MTKKTTQPTPPAAARRAKPAKLSAKSRKAKQTKTASAARIKPDVITQRELATVMYHYHFALFVSRWAHSVAGRIEERLSRGAAMEPGDFGYDTQRKAPTGPFVAI